MPYRVQETAGGRLCVITKLIEAGFLIPSDRDETKYASQVRKMLQQLQPKPKYKTSFTILTTTDCNARCFYCFEAGQRRECMSAQTASDVADYIINSCGNEKVSISWFGGEPLYNREAIDIITGKLIEQKIPFTSTIVTNGYYLDQETIAKCKNAWNVESLNITLDGTENVYNKTKAYIEPDENPYETVLENIRQALPAGLNIYIRLNMNERNAENLHKLVDELRRMFRSFSNLKVYIVLLHPFAGEVHEFSSEDEAIAQYQLLQNKIDAAGFGYRPELNRSLLINNCIADNDAAELIRPDGRIGKCEHFSDSDIIGSIYEPSRDLALIQSWKELREPFVECLTCPLYPRCINLEKCAWLGDHCRKTTRTLRIEKLKKQILAAWLDWKKEQERENPVKSEIR